MASFSQSEHSPPTTAFDPTALLFLIVIAAALAWMAAESSLAALAIVAGAVAPALIYWMSRNSAAAAALLALAVVTSRLYVEVGASKARPEHIAIGLLVGAMLLRLAQGYAPGREPPCWMAADLLLLAYIALNFFSSAFFSLSSGDTLRWAAQQTLAILPYFILRMLATDKAGFRRALRIILLIGSVEAAYAVLCFLSYVLFQTQFGIAVDQYGDIPGIHGTQYEANILGSTSGAVFLVMLALYLYRRERNLLVGIAVSFAATIVSLSRGALLATGLAAVWLLWQAWRRRQISTGSLRAVALTLVCICLALGPLVGPMWVQRFSEVDTTDIAGDPDARVRMLTTASAFAEIADHPIFGNGTASFQLNFDLQDIGMTNDDPSVAGWISNSEVRVLHDTGIVGLGVFFALLLTLWVRGRRILRRAPHPELLGLLAAWVLYCVAFQFTEGRMLAFCWVHVGLLAAGIVLWKDGNAAAGSAQGRAE